MKKGYIPRDQRKKILMLSDDIRTYSGVGGMAKDTSRQDQPEGTYRDALNTIVNLETGTINNEFGASSTGGANIEVLGVIPINKDRVIFLGLDNDEVSTIALIDPTDQTSQILYKNTNLYFNNWYSGS